MAVDKAVQERQMRLAEELLFSGQRKPGFAKALYFGEFDAERVLPFPSVSEGERRRVDESVGRLKAFAEEKIDPDWIDRHASIPQSVIEGLGRLGVLGMTIPPEYGGQGASQYGYCRAMEALARRCGSTALFVNAHQSIGPRALVLFGTKEQKSQWLPALARGEKLAAFSLTEPEAGSDAANVQTRAVFDPVKNVYRITGRKQWTTNGSIAGVLTVMARTEVETPQGKEDKITAFLVTPDMPGFKVLDPALEKVGMRGSTTSNLAFENMEVPAANVLGPMGAGLKVALTVLDFGRTTFGATCTGAAKELLERAIQHARMRVQFQRPLAAFPLVKRKLAKMAGLVYAMDATTYMTAGLLDKGESDFMLETAMLKVFTSESLWDIVYETMQVFGGRSFFTDAPYERMMRDARLNMIGEGANEVLRAFIGAVGMRDVGMSLQAVSEALHHPRGHFSELLAFGRHSMGRVLNVPVVPLKSRPLAGEARQLGRAIRRFGMAIVRLLAKYREGIVEQQLALDRIATSAIAIYTATAVLSKLDSDLERGNGNAPALERDVAVGKLYCREAFDTIERALGGLRHNHDAAIEGVSDRLSGV